jgi:hypothetical protein
VTTRLPNRKQPKARAAAAANYKHLLMHARRARGKKFREADCVAAIGRQTRQTFTTPPTGARSPRRRHFPVPPL